MGLVAFSAIYAAFLKFGVGMENVHGDGWILVMIVYFGSIGVIANQ
jgi:hypothetical protein